jgi:hypothetical protein
MSLPNPRPLDQWPMTTEAWSALRAELDRLDAELAVAPAPGIVRLPVGDPARRRDQLRRVRDGAVVDDSPGIAMIGRRVSIRDDGEVETYALVLPGDGDPSQGWVSADSPLGAAVLGAQPGQRVQVLAPAGPREVEVTAVE